MSQILTALFLVRVKGEKKRHGARQNVVKAQNYVSVSQQRHAAVVPKELHGNFVWASSVNRILSSHSASLQTKL